MSKEIPLQTWVVWVLRKASYKWMPRNLAIRAAKTGPNIYKCASCKKDVFKKRMGRRSTISADHIVPVKDPSKPGAFQDDLKACLCGVCTSIRRMFCSISGYQMLCMKCHDIKTKSEMDTRIENRRKKKKQI